MRSGAAPIIRFGRDEIACDDANLEDRIGMRKILVREKDEQQRKKPHPARGHVASV
jgi:hypothetical protein